MKQMENIKEVSVMREGKNKDVQIVQILETNF